MNPTKKIFVLAFASLIGLNAQAAFVIKNNNLPKTETVSTSNTETTKLVAEQSLTKHQVKKLDKLTQKFVKQQQKEGSSGISKGLYVVMSIFGLGWLAMGILDNFSGSDWLISLLLTCLFILPGIIYSLVKMKNYYK